MALETFTLTLPTHSPESGVPLEGKWRVAFLAGDNGATDDAGGALAGVGTKHSTTGVTTYQLADTEQDGFDPQGTQYKAWFISDDGTVSLESEPFLMDRDKNWADISVQSREVVTPTLAAQAEAARDDALDARDEILAIIADFDASGGAVDSVNAQTGVVVLDADDVGADPAGAAASAATAAVTTAQSYTDVAVSGEATARATAISTAINALLDSPPGTLDTLNELAAALGDDPNFATTLMAAIGGKQPLDADLTAIAALTTTPWGRALLTVADATAGRAALALGSAATEPADAFDAAGSAAAAQEFAVQRGNHTGTQTTATISDFASAVVDLAPNELEVVVYSGTAGTTRPSAAFVVWQGFPTQPTNMADGDLWLSDLGGTVLSGAGAPTSGDGANGDFWIRTSNSTIYGPKTAGAWGSATSLVGAAGANGRGITSIARTSGTGAPGTTDTYTITYSDSTTSTFTVTNGAGVPAGGTTSQVLAKNSGTDFDTHWVDQAGGSSTRPRSFYTLPAGGIAATYDRTQAPTQGGQALVSGSLYLVAVVLAAGDVISNVNARAVTGWNPMSHSWAGLWNASRQVLAISADDGTAIVSSSTSKAWALGSPYTVPTTGMYYAGIMLAGTGLSTLGISIGSLQSSTIPPITVGISETGQTTPPSVGATSGVISPSTALPYLWLT